jgi:nitroreductase
MGLYMKKRRSVRHFTRDTVPKEKIEVLLDIARYAASSGNSQPLEWIVVHDPEWVKKIAGLTVEWMRTLLGSDHPLSGYLPVLIAAWDAGRDPICRGAPHLLFATVPEGNPTSQVDAIIALTHFDLAAPAFGIDVCWAGFVAGAALYHEPLRNELHIPEGRQSAYALMFGNPQYRITAIPRRNPLRVTWK